MSAGRSFNAMAVPPAATMARFDADLSMIALEAIGTQQNLLNQSPGFSRTSLFAHTEPARDIPGRFHRASDPPPRECAYENRRDHLKPGSAFISYPGGKCRGGRFQDCSDPMSLL
ncbi:MULTISPECIES: hypothetical protein [unclassified Mesorhizobium]|uniref:hypothetical protein n=1 Tax=unclassified Mesorhizobium TaxID=325217 RepID=UPI002415DF37|nr:MULTISPECIES: hypothetical protein [unclassified Mesorhizobium]WFP61113.1 hypothetical protein QAZ47_21780 [Mesorhizobium sp. WSM4904]WFP74341.1 hypothetical protein QAZ22_21680 [Mesorhizobium sp. WSM4906]